MINNWYLSKQFNDAEITEAKRIRAEKDKAFGGDYYNGKIDNRWTGTLAEWAFKHWLIREKIPYYYWQNVKSKDKKDFTIYDNNEKPILEIDVKSINDYEPDFQEKNYFALVVQDQIGNNEVNSYVFARYNLTQNRVMIFGWIPKKEFLQKAVFRGTKERSYIARDAYDIPVYELNLLLTIHEARQYGV